MENPDDPVDIREAQKRFPWWPFAADATYRLVRNGKLGAIAIGRRRFVTERLLRDCIASHMKWLSPKDES